MINVNVRCFNVASVAIRLMCGMLPGTIHVENVAQYFISSVNLVSATKANKHVVSNQAT